MKSRRFIHLVLALVLVLPSVFAAPEIRDVSEATVFVDGVTDTITIHGSFLPGTWFYTLTAPDGQQITFTKTSTTNGAADVSTYDLSGTLVDGPSWTVTGDLNGAIAEGTWTIATNSLHTNNLEANDKPVVLAIQSKTVSYPGPFLANPVYDAVQLWNWHITATAFQDGSAATIGPDVAIAADEDPNLARYFAPVIAPVPSTPADDNPRAVTGGQSTADCTAVDVDVNAAWFRGTTQTQDTYGYFTYVTGFQAANTDLTSVPGAATTTLTNLGAGQNGQHAATIPYDNPLGVSYQFTARNGSAGANQDGLTFYIASNQCDDVLPTFTGGLNLARLNIRFTASQAQCHGDAVGFTIVEDLVNALISQGWTVAIVRNSDDIVIANLPQASWHSAVDGFYWLEDEYPPGAYTAAFIGTGSTGLIRAIDAVAFNVPENTCKDEPVTVDIGNISIEFSDFLISLLINETLEHRDNSLELNGLDFETLGFDGFLILLLLIAVFAFALWHGYTFIMLVSGLGIVMSWLPDAPIGFVGIVYLLVVAFMLEYFVGGFDGLRKRFRRDHEEDESNPW